MRSRSWTVGSLRRMSDLQAAASVVDQASKVVESAVKALATGSIDEQQVLAYDFAHAAAGVEISRSLLDYGGKGEIEAQIPLAFFVRPVPRLAPTVVCRGATPGRGPRRLDRHPGVPAPPRHPAVPP